MQHFLSQKKASVITDIVVLNKNFYGQNKNVSCVIIRKKHYSENCQLKK